MDTTHGKIALCRKATAVLASTRIAVCSLPSSNLWLRLVGHATHETIGPRSVVLLNQLPALLLAAGAQGAGHG